MTSVMNSWNCSDNCNSSSGVVSAPEHGCVAPSMCVGVQRHRCVVRPPRAVWRVDDPESPHPVVRPCPQAVDPTTSFCSQRYMKVHADPYLDGSDVAYCRAPRFPTSVTVDTSSCRTSAINEESYYNSGTL